MSETGVILTPDQRLRVFVSSTLEELAAEHGRSLTGTRAIRHGLEDARPDP